MSARVSENSIWPMDTDRFRAIFGLGIAGAPPAAEGRKLRMKALEDLAEMEKEDLELVNALSLPIPWALSTQRSEAVDGGKLEQPRRLLEDGLGEP